MNDNINNNKRGQEGEKRFVTRPRANKSASRHSSPPEKTDAVMASRSKYKRSKHFELARKTALSAFSALSVLAVIVCTFLGYSYSGNSIRELSLMSESERSGSKAYRIVYSDADSFGKEAANMLQGLFFEKTGASLEVVDDSERVGRHEIRIGYTNRASDDYITSLATLGKDGYAILLSGGDNVNITAFSEAGVTAAVKYFVDSYVGSYIGTKLTLQNKMNVSFVSRSGEEPSVSLNDSKIRLSFGDDGNFRVLLFSDADTSPYTLGAIEAITSKEKPQLVLFAGDASSGISSKAELEKYVSELSAPLEEKKIPWAVIFGEQDTDGGLSAEIQMSVYSSFDHCIAKNDFVSNGTVSYFLPIYKNDEAKTPSFGIWAMGQTAMLSQSSNASSKDPLLESYRQNGTDYGYVTSSQIAWFAESNRYLDRQAGGMMRSVVVSHTPIEELDVIAKNSESSGFSGSKNEAVSSSPINSGLFAAMVEAGNVLGYYCGHDHLNSYSGRYCGIELGYMASIGYDGYGLGGTFDINNSLRGGRIVDISLDRGEIELKTRMIYAADCGIGID